MNNDGTCNINIILNTTIDSVLVRKSLFTGYNVNPKYWDTTQGKVKTEIAGADMVNNVINEILLKLNKIRFDLEYRQKEAMPDKILEVYRNDNYESESSDFLAFTEKEIHSTRKDYSLKHYQSLMHNLKNLRDFAGITLLFDEITPSFLDKYRYWMEHENGNKKNSIYQRLSNIRKMMNIAIQRDLTTNYPFKNYKIKGEEVDKEYLELDEVEKLHQLYYNADLPSGVKVTLHYFLLSCYTGLRLSDIKKVNKDTIKHDIITLKTQKTGAKVSIPLNQAALSLMNFDLEGLSLFERTIKQSSHRISKDLNDALELAKIKNKYITFHCSRHTFAINSLILGIPLEVVSKILGHTELKTTQIYAKVVDNLVNREMKKWNNISFPSKTTKE
jgi:site-specific recombinase XerD